MNPDLLLTGKRTIQKEIFALQQYVETLDESFVAAAETIFGCRGTVLLTGMGKSGLVARKWASTFSSTGTKSYFINPAEAPHGDLGIIHSQDVLVALSLSGETKELDYLISYARERGLQTIGITGNGNSSLARQSSILLIVHLSEEACPLGLAPTTSTTIMMALGDAFAVTLMQMRGFTSDDFARLHPGGSLGRRLWLRVEELMHTGEAIPRVSPNDPLEHVLIEITRKCLGHAVVMDGERIVGLITDGDLRRFFQLKKGSEMATAAQMMTRNPKTISSRALAVEAREMMEKNSIHQLIIVDFKNQLAGVIHLHDLLRAKVL